MGSRPGICPDRFTISKLTGRAAPERCGPFFAFMFDVLTGARAGATEAAAFAFSMMIWTEEDADGPDQDPD